MATTIAPICIYHRKEMIAHREKTPLFVRVYKDEPNTRFVFRCPVSGCPRIEVADHDFTPSPGFRIHGKNYMQNI